MIDRWGNQIIVAWPEHQILWIEAAMTLPFGKRTAAYQQIADMTGRTLCCVEHKVRRIRTDRAEKERRAAKRAALVGLAAARVAA